MSEHKNEVLKEHKNKVKFLRSAKNALPWQIATGVLLVLLVFSVVLGGSFSLPSGSQDQIIEDTMDYININLLGGLAEAELNDVSEEYGMYKLKITVSGKEFTSYVTKDGKMLMPTVLDTTNGINIPDETEPTEVERVEIDTTGLTVRGNPDGEVLIIEFSDFECPYCARGATTIEEVLEAYDEVGVVFMQFPLSFHANAQKAAEASLCANEQGMFWEYHDVLFADQGALDVDSLKSSAEALRLDTEAFNTCLDEDTMADTVSAQMGIGQSNGVSGTPAFFINGISLVGAQPLSAFQEIIDAELSA
ncbi:MAG: DsbA family protein [archaeon]